MNRTVLILGARGRFGQAAAKAFADANWRVVAHRRPKGNTPESLAQDGRIEWIECASGDLAAMKMKAAGASILVHAINPIYTNRAWSEEALPMLRASIELAKELGATLMLPGNVYNFGADMPAVLKENTPQQAHTVKGKIRMQLEDELKHSQIRSVVIRAGDFFGSGTGNWFDEVIVKNIRKGKFTYPADMDTSTAWAYLPDLARTFALVAEKCDSLSNFEVLHFAGHNTNARLWLQEITPIAHEQGWVKSGESPRYSKAPWLAIRFLGWFVPTMGAIAEMRYLWNKPYSLANNRLVQLLGSEPHTELSVALRSAFKELGLLNASKANPQASVMASMP